MEKSKFEISKVYTIRWKIRVCYKDLIPLLNLKGEMFWNGRPTVVAA